MRYTIVLITFCLLFLAISEVEAGRRVVRTRQIVVQSQGEMVLTGDMIFLPKSRVFFQRRRLFGNYRFVNPRTFRTRSITREVIRGIEPVRDDLDVPTSP
jgi:hypothetical protein